MRDRRTRTWGWALGLSVVLALLMSVASAGKPSKPPPEPLNAGIYYANSSGFYVMDANGENQTLLTHKGKNPSHHLHNGERWYVRQIDVEGEFYPDGRQAFEIWVTNQSNTKLVQITDDLLFEHGVSPPRQAWMSGDEGLSWIGHYWDYDEDTQTYSIEEAGIWYAPFVFDSEGNITGIDGDPILAASCGYEYDAGSGNYIIDIQTGFSWSPGNEKVAFASKSPFDPDHGLYVTTIAEPYDAVWICDRGGYCDWSTTNLITFAEVWIINPDGTGLEQLISPRNNTSLLLPRFSPDGKEIVYAVWDGRAHSVYKTSVSKPRGKRLADGYPGAWR